FDVATPKEASKARDNTQASLQELASGLDLEDLEVTGLNLEAHVIDNDDGDKEGTGNIDGESPITEEADGWIDETREWSEEECQELDEAVTPVKFVLVKLRKLSFAIIHSSTILLPQWHELLKRLELPDRIMPRDVRTRWNSTYAMLDFALQYREAIAEFTGSLRTNL
ncbi:hypothetical protein BC629DRAFT_1253789, partial [Irpex lacteus]